jgi:hypothetical protein
MALALGGSHLPDDEGSVGHLALDVVQLLLPLFLLLWRALSTRGTSHDNKPTPPGGGQSGVAASKRRSLVRDIATAGCLRSFILLWSEIPGEQ